MTLASHCIGNCSTRIEPSCGRLLIMLRSKNKIEGLRPSGSSSGSSHYNNRKRASRAFLVGYLCAYRAKMSLCFSLLHHQSLYFYTQTRLNLLIRITQSRNPPVSQNADFISSKISPLLLAALAQADHNCKCQDSNGQYSSLTQVCCNEQADPYTHITATNIIKCAISLVQNFS